MPLVVGDLPVPTAGASDTPGNGLGRKARANHNAYSAELRGEYSIEAHRRHPQDGFPRGIDASSNPPLHPE